MNDMNHAFAKANTNSKSMFSKFNELNKTMFNSLTIENSMKTWGLIRVCYIC